MVTATDAVAVFPRSTAREIDTRFTSAGQVTSVRPVAVRPPATTRTATVAPHGRDLKACVKVWVYEVRPDRLASRVATWSPLTENAAVTGTAEVPLVVMVTWARAPPGGGVQPDPQPGHLGRALGHADRGRTRPAGGRRDGADGEGDPPAARRLGQDVPQGAGVGGGAAEPYPLVVDRLAADQPGGVQDDRRGAGGGDGVRPAGHGALHRETVHGEPRHGGDRGVVTGGVVTGGVVTGGVVTGGVVTGGVVTGGVVTGVVTGGVVTREVVGVRVGVRVNV